MASDQTRRRALEAALSDAINERHRLDVVIGYLSEKLGRPVELPGVPGTGPGQPVDDPAHLVADGEFYGMSAPAAAVRVLQKVGKPNALKTEQLVSAIRKGGVKVKNAGTLYRSLIRHTKFKRVGKGLWGLAEWYPQPPQARTSTREAVQEQVGTPEPESEERPETEVA
jgi:hypothetical protein